MDDGLLIIAELVAGRLRRTTASAIAFATRLRAHRPGPITLLVAGHDVATAAAEAARYAVDRVLLVDHPALADGLAEALLPTAAAIAQRHGLTLAAASSFGKDLLPRLAAQLDVGYVADCSEVRVEADALVFRRAIYAGHAWEDCRFTSPRGVLTVRQSDVPPAAPGEGPSAPIVAAERVPTGAARERIERLAFTPAPRGERPELTEARVVVAGGRPLGDRFFPLLAPLADELGAALGATRAACDGGHAPADLQVGQTGKIVAPELYLAVGISGAIQHLAGIRGARVIAAIDRDPEAPIFELADYGLVADLAEAVPELTRALAAHRQRPR